MLGRKSREKHRGANTDKLTRIEVKTGDLNALLRANDRRQVEQIGAGEAKGKKAGKKHNERNYSDRKHKRVQASKQIIQGCRF